MPTRDGYVRINPYATLIASYEHLIGARGNEVKDIPPADNSVSVEAGTSVSEAAVAVAASAVVPGKKIAAGAHGKSGAKASNRSKTRPVKLKSGKRR